MTVHRRDGIWWTEFEVNGRSYKRSTGRASKQSALEFESRLRTHLYDLKRAGRTKEMTLGEALDRYTETVIFTKRRAPDDSLRHTCKNDLLRKNVVEEHFGRNTLLIDIVKRGDRRFQFQPRETNAATECQPASVSASRSAQQGISVGRAACAARRAVQP
jgi:hypothetical protein